MGRRANTAILIILFLIVLATRLYLAYSTPVFSSDDSYFHLRQIEHIKETGAPIFHDDLSFSGRTNIFSPAFHYFIAVFALFLPTMLVAKLILNIFAASLIFFVYLIAKKITNNSFVSLFTAFLSGFVPVFFAETITELNPVCIVIPLMFLLIYAFMNIQDQRWLYCYLVLLVFLSLIHPIILLFILGLIIYLILILIERLKQNREELEISLFSIFFVLWAQFILYKKLIVFHGPAVIWQNIPAPILNNYFAHITVLEAIYNIGIVPLIVGLYVIYLFSFKKKNRQIYLIIAFAASAGLLLWLRLINVNVGLMMFGIVLVILFAQWLNKFIVYVKQSRASNFLSLFLVLIFAGLLVLSVYPSIEMAKISLSEITPAEITALEWIEEHTPEDAVIIAAPQEGNLITAIAKRKNILDTFFLLQPDAKQRFDDVKRVYSACLEIEVVEIMDKYEADYIYFSDNAKKLSGKDELSFLDKCFGKVYDQDVEIHKRIGCELTVIK
ncbi:hypothetical protein KY346_03140 [Candidatus Woesearchaeota archaeon]|nr:hypothetical protein [Candidatus Woesearchaeota archaeon]